MKVTREVVMDLLPLYLSGEASADSRALIVAFLAQDPELAERIRAEPQDLFRNAAQPQLPADLEVRSLRHRHGRYPCGGMLDRLLLGATPTAFAVTTDGCAAQTPASRQPAL